jgi:hypothetical protein
MASLSPYFSTGFQPSRKPTGLGRDFQCTIQQDQALRKVISRENVRHGEPQDHQAGRIQLTSSNGKLNEQDTTSFYLAFHKDT